MVLNQVWTINDIASDVKLDGAFLLPRLLLNWLSAWQTEE